MAARSVTDYPMTIDGEAIASGDFGVVLSPFDRSEVGRYPLGTVADLDRAVAAARSALPAWAALDDARRKQYCVEIAQVFEAHAGELAELITREQGKPIVANGFGS